jgi:hypothetical protein
VHVDDPPQSALSVMGRIDFTMAERPPTTVGDGVIRIAAMERFGTGSGV